MRSVVSAVCLDVTCKNDLFRETALNSLLAKTNGELRQYMLLLICSHGVNVQCYRRKGISTGAVARELATV